MQIRELRAELEDPAVQYPEYYVQPFHAYEEGNLNWLAAFEVESATYAMALRTFPGQGLSPAQAQRRLRDGIHAALRVRLPLCVCCRRSRGPCGSSSWSHCCLQLPAVKGLGHAGRKGVCGGHRPNAGTWVPCPSRAQRVGRPCKMPSIWEQHWADSGQSTRTSN